MYWPLPEAATEAFVILGGNFPAGTGSLVGLGSSPITSTDFCSPVAGSSRRNSPPVVTIRARPSPPNATPNGECPIAYVCLVFWSRFRMVSALVAGTGQFTPSIRGAGQAVVLP